VLIEKRQPVTLDIQKELNDKKMQLLDTGAGVEVAAEVGKNGVRWENDMRNFRQEMQEAIAQRDLAYKKELEDNMKETETKLRGEQEEICKMRIDGDQLFQQMRQHHEQEAKKWTELLQVKDRLIEGAQKEASDLKQSNDLELEKFKLEMKLKEHRYRMAYATRCIVM
jgi:hypothetical protein